MSGLDSALGAGQEFDRIRRLAARWRERARGLGDDCAFIEAGGERLAISIDLSLEGVHFRREWLPPADVGYRAVAAALSDLAAVAAVPQAVLLAIGLPPGFSDADLDALADGAGDASGDAGALIVGGNMSRSERLLLDVCVIGRAAAPVLRSGARPGDRLVVTGVLGGPAAALAEWQQGREPAPVCRERFARPAARHAAARFLASHGARAMIDISDGLAADCGHLLAASGVGAQLNMDLVPVLPAARDWAAAHGEPAWRLAARSGEEYELLAALPDSVSDAVLAAAPVLVTAIGVCEPETGLRAIVDGSLADLPAGHDHFADSA